MPGFVKQITTDCTNNENNKISHDPRGTGKRDLEEQKIL